MLKALFLLLIRLNLWLEFCDYRGIGTCIWMGGGGMQIQSVCGGGNPYIETILVKFHQKWGEGGLGAHLHLPPGSNTPVIYSWNDSHIKDFFHSFLPSLFYVWETRLRLYSSKEDQIEIGKKILAKYIHNYKVCIHS